MDKFIDSNYLQQIADDVLALAKQKGATAAEISVHRDQGRSINIRQQEIETIESIQDQGLSVTVYFGEKKGNASGSDLSALEKTVTMACAIAQHTQGDSDFGLADKDLLSKKHQDLALDYPWKVSTQDLVAQAMACEDTALQADSLISNSEGASADTSRAVNVYANSNGFNDYVISTRHEVACSVVAGEKDAMQRDYDYTVARDATQLRSPESVGLCAAEKAVKKMGGRALPTGNYPVIFDASVSSGLFGYLLQGISGMALYHKTSFLVDSLGKQLFPDFIQLQETPYLLGGWASAAFDAEGVATRAKYFIQDGILQSYVLGSYSARKLGMKTTANAGGVFNLALTPTVDSQKALLQEMGSGFLVTEFMGSGVNMMTGDYSRGASGFWVQDGVIEYPVDEVTVAGNLSEMWQGIVAVADDADLRRSAKTGSILLKNMVVSGN